MNSIQLHTKKSPVKKPKKSKLGFDEGIDRIGDLPDEILCKILRLLPIKFAVRTEILSTRWKGLFSVTDNLNLDFDDHPPYVWYVKDSSAFCQGSKLKFIEFVYRCFSVLRGNVKHVNRFKLSTRLRYENQETHLKNWISSALDFNVREVDVNIVREWSPFVIPASETLVVLKLQGFMNVKILDDSVGLPNLKVLHLVNVCVGDEYLNRVLKECRLLEELVLDHVEDVSVLEISTPALKRVTIYRIFFVDVDDLEIGLVLNVPSLEYFYFDDYLPTSISASLPSLVDAHISLSAYSYQDEEHVESLTKLVKLCRQVRVLTLSSKALLDILPMDPSSLFVFHNLKQLVLGRLYASKWALLPNLLQNSPKLETLVFEEGFSIHVGPGTSMPRVVPGCVSSHLTSVEIKYFIGKECEFKWVEYFLSRADILQSMRISSYKKMSFVKQVWLMKKLLDLPRRSKDCRLLVTSDPD